MVAAHGEYLDALCTRVLLLGAPEAGGARHAAPPLPARAALDGALLAVLRFTKEVSAILAAAEPLAEQAKEMGIRATGVKGAGALTADAAAAADEARAVLCSKLDVLVKRRGPQVAELTAAYRVQLERLLAEFEALESRCASAARLDALRPPLSRISHPLPIRPTGTRSCACLRRCGQEIEYAAQKPTAVYLSIHLLPRQPLRAPPAAKGGHIREKLWASPFPRAPLPPQQERGG